MQMTSLPRDILESNNTINGERPLKKVCVINIALTHSVARTRAIAPYCEEIRYLDVGTGGVSERDFVGTQVIYERLFSENQSRKFGVLRLIAALRRIEPDVIVCFYMAGPMYLAALLYGRCPVVGVAMGTDVLHELGDRPVRWYSWLMRRACFHQTSMIVAKSKSLTQRLRKDLVTCPIVINYWGCDTRRFLPGSKSEARENLGLPNDRFVVLSPRGIAPLYRISEILEAFGSALKETGKMYLVVIGRTSKTAHYYQRYLESYVATHQLSDSVSLVFDVLPDQVPDYIRAADVVVTAAKTEGFPNTIFEAMACERPVIAFTIPQLEELLSDGKNVLFSEPSSQSLAKIMVSAMRSPQLNETLSRGAQAICRQFGDIERNATLFATTVSSVLASQRKRMSNRIRAKLAIVYLLNQCCDSIFRLWVSICERRRLPGPSLQ